MLSETKTALRITTDAYDSEIASLLSAAALDLEIAGVIIPGTPDPLITRAMITYVRMHFGSPADYDRLADSYELQKTQLMHASQYTDYGAGV